MTTYQIEEVSIFDNYADYKTSFAATSDLHGARPIYDDLYIIVKRIQDNDCTATDEELRRGFELVNAGLAIEPTFPGFYIGKGFLQMVAKDLKQAIHTFKHAIQLDKRFHDAYCFPGDAEFGIGACYLMMEEYGKAKKHLYIAKEMGNPRAPGIIDKYLWWHWW